MRNKILIILIVAALPAKMVFAGVSANECYIDPPASLELNVDGNMLRFLHGKIYDEIYHQQITLPPYPCNESLCFHGATRNIPIEPPIIPMLPVINIRKICFDSGANLNGKNILITAKVGNIVYEHPLMNQNDPYQIFNAYEDIEIELKTSSDFEYNGLRLPYLEIRVPLRRVSRIKYNHKLGLDAVITGWGCKEWHCDNCKHDIPDLNLNLNVSMTLSQPRITYRIQPIIVDGKFFGFNPNGFIDLPEVNVSASVDNVSFSNGFWDLVGGISGLKSRIKNELSTQLKSVARKNGEKIIEEILNRTETQINKLVKNIVIALGKVMVGEGVGDISLADQWSFVNDQDIIDQFYITSFLDVEGNLTNEEGMVFRTPSPLILNIINSAIRNHIINASDPLAAIQNSSFVNSIKNEIEAQYEMCPEPTGLNRDWSIAF